jgi:uncharacterized protein YoxC
MDKINAMLQDILNRVLKIEKTLDEVKDDVNDLKEARK